MDLNKILGWAAKMLINKWRHKLHRYIDRLLANCIIYYYIHTSQIKLGVRCCQNTRYWTEEEEDEVSIFIRFIKDFLYEVIMDGVGWVFFKSCLWCQNPYFCSIMQKKVTYILPLTSKFLKDVHKTLEKTCSWIIYDAKKKERKEMPLRLRNLALTLIIHSITVKSNQSTLDIRDLLLLPST